MIRKLILLFVVGSFFALASPEPAQARQWSPGNPGVYGNIHGLTYRSSSWERKYGNRKQPVRRTRARIFRRR